MRPKQLTKAEEQVMHYVWQAGKCFLKDIVDQFPEPRPAYTTVSTVIRVLVKKEFLAYKTYGKSHEYYPLVSKASYLKRRLKKMISNYFDGSPTQFVSYFANEHMNISELQEIRQLIEDKINKLENDGN